ncbi:MAG: hypothetical protein JO249_02390 [Acidobacteria bacterium]|nr:hypothetical protein [Acidobacteriota bacterium]
MSPVADNPLIAPDRELDEEKNPGASEITAAHPLPSLRLVAAQGGSLALRLRQ